MIKESEMTQEQQEIIIKYTKNNMQQLKKLCYPLIKKIGGISQMDYDDLYSIALNVLANTISMYDRNKGSYETFLYNSIRKKFYTYIRDKNREKRKCPYTHISFEQYKDEGIDLEELIGNNCYIEDDIPELNEMTDKTKKYLSNLSVKQRKIIALLLMGYDKTQIKDLLHMTQTEFADNYKDLSSHENVSILF